MKQSKKWAEQILVEESLSHKTESGEEVVETTSRLMVCTHGRELFRKEFIEKKYKGKNRQWLPFDFILLAGDMCPKGRFYELEYTIEKPGAMYRALIQAVDPVTDLPLIIASLKARNMIPADVKPYRAWLREDIDVVNIGMCDREDGEAVFSCSYAYANDGSMDGEKPVTVREYGDQNHGACLYYYRGDHRELWTHRVFRPGQKEEKIFVCGVNGTDPEFADRRRQAIIEMRDNLEQAVEIADSFSIPYLYVFDMNDDDKVASVGTNIRRDTLRKMLDAIINGLDKK